jgi:hypothetical protein
VETGEANCRELQRSAADRELIGRWFGKCLLRESLNLPEDLAARVLARSSPASSSLSTSTFREQETSHDCAANQCNPDGVQRDGVGFPHVRTDLILDNEHADVNRVIMTKLQLNADRPPVTSTQLNCHELKN